MLLRLSILFLLSFALSAAGNVGVASSGGLGNGSRLAELFGLTMLPLWISSSILVALIFERMAATRRNAIVDDAIIDRILEHMSAGRLEKARDCCAESKTVLGYAWARGLRDFSLGRESLKASLTKAVQSTLQPLENSITSVQTISVIAPLMGLLGTIIGMVAVFGELSNTATPDKAALADGIMEALFTTAAGLIIAIPGIICGRWLKARIASYADLATDTVDRMQEAFLLAGGIEPKRKAKKGRHYGI